MSAQWPSALVTTSQLYVAVNELQNNLSGAINNSVTTIGLNSTTGFPTVGLVLIDNEVIQYTGVSGNNLTGCTRAFDGTSAATHSSGATVSFAFCAASYNNAANEIIAVESYLDTVLGKGTAVTATEFTYLHGVTSAIQTQLGTKAPTASPTFSGTITTPLTASRAMVTGASNELAISATTATEIGYVSGVTSAIQTQLNAKVGSASPTLTGTVTVPNGVNATDAAAFGQIHYSQIPQFGSETTGGSTTSSSFADVGATCTITPKSASSHIKITVAFTAQTGASGVFGQFGIWGTTTGDLYTTTTTPAFIGGFGSGYFTVSFFAYDAPGTTSAQTYKIRFARSGTGTLFVGGAANSGAKTTIIAEEVI